MYEQTNMRKEHPIAFRTLSIVLAIIIILSCVIIGIPSLLLRARASDPELYKFVDGNFVPFDDTAAAAYVNEQDHAFYSYYAAYKVPKLSDKLLVLGNDLQSVHTYVDGNADNGTGAKNRNYFFSDTEVNIIGNLRTPFDGSTSINTSVWHKKALNFTTAVQAGYSASANPTFKDFVDAVEVDAQFVRHEERNFFPDNIYVDWTDSINWKMYDIQFALRDYLADYAFDYFKTSSVKDSWDNGAVWVDDTTNLSSYYQEAAASPKNIYVPTVNSSFKSNSAFSDNGKTEDIHPFLYLCSETLPQTLTANTSYENWFKGVDQYGVNFSSANLSYSVSGNAGDLVTIDPATGEITVGAIPENTTKTAIITVTAKTVNSQYPLETISFALTVGETFVPKNASRYTNWDSEMAAKTTGDVADADFYNFQFQTDKTVTGPENYDISLDIPQSLPIKTTPVDITNKTTNYRDIMKSLRSVAGGSGGNAACHYKIDTTKTRFSEIVLEKTSTTGGYNDSYSQAWDKVKSALGVTLIASIDADKKTCTDEGGFLADSSLTVGGNGTGSGYTLLINQNLKEGWYCIYEQDSHCKTYHTFYLSADSTNPLIINGERIAFLANSEIYINSNGYDIAELKYNRPMENAIIKVDGHETNAVSTTAGSYGIIDGKENSTLQKGLYQESIPFFPEQLTMSWLSDAGSLPMTQQGKYTVTFGGTFAANESIVVAGTTFKVKAGRTSQNNVASDVKTALASNPDYDVTVSSNVLTLTEKAGHFGVGVPSVIEASKNGTVTVATVTPGAGYDTAFKIKSTTDYYDTDYIINDVNNGDQAFFGDDYLVTDSAFESSSIFAGLKHDGTSNVKDLNNGYKPNAEKKKVDFYPFLYNYSLTGSLFDTQKATIDSGFVDIADGVLTNFKPTVIRGSVSNKTVGFSGIDQYGVLYQALEYSIVDSDKREPMTVPNGVTFDSENIAISVDNAALENAVTELTIKITALTKNSYNDANGNAEKETNIYIPLIIYKDYTIKYDADDGEFPSGYTPPIDTFTPDTTHTYSEYISTVKEPVKEGALFVAWYDEDDPSKTPITPDTVVTNEDHVLKPLWSTDNYTIEYYDSDGTLIDSRLVLPDHPIFSDIVTNYDVYDQAKNNEEGKGRFVGWHLGSTSGDIISTGTANETTDLADKTNDNVIKVYAAFEKEYEFDFHNADGTVTPIIVSESELGNNIYANYLTDNITVGEVEDIYGNKINYALPNDALLPDGFSAVFDSDTSAVHPWAALNSTENPLYTVDVDDDTTYTVYPEGNYTPENGYITSSDIQVVDDTDNPVIVGENTFYPKKEIVTDPKSTFEKVALAVSGEPSMDSIPSGTVFDVYEALDVAHITYDPNAGTDTVNNLPGPEALTYENSADISSSTPTRPGYTFSEWNTNPDGSGDVYNPSDPYKDKNEEPVSVVLYAQWDENTADLKFDPNAGTDTVTGMPEDDTLTYPDGKTVPNNVPERSGYTFLGWSEDPTATTPTVKAGDVVKGANEEPEDTTYYAVWKSLTDATLSYDPNAGTDTVSSMPEDQIMTYKDPTEIAFNIPTRPGYTFVEWNTEADGSGDAYSPYDSYKLENTLPTDATLYAQWEENTADLKFIPNAGTDTVTGMPDDDTLTYPDGKTVPTNVPVRPGYTFLGWAEDPTATTPTVKAGDVVKGANEEPEDTTYYAVWQKNIDSIVYNPNANGDPVDKLPDTQTLTYDNPADISSNVPTRPGYTFKEWNTNPDGSGKTYNPSDPYKDKNEEPEPLTLYAQWDENTADLKFDPNAGTDTVTKMPANDTLTYPDGKTVPNNVPERPGYTFLGWSEDPTATTPTVKAGDTIKEKNTEPEDTTYYAVWKENTATLTFDPNAGTDTVTKMPENDTLTYSEGSNVPTNVPVRPGYTFLGWAEDPTATTPTKIAGDTIKEKNKEPEDVTYYAVWQENTATITYIPNADGDTVKNFPENKDLNYKNSASISPDVPSRKGYTFTEWNTMPDGSGKTYDPSDPYKKANEEPEALILYAQWTPDKHRISFITNGGTDIDPIIEPYNTDVTKPQDPTKPGYIFDGWYKDPSLTTPMDVPSKMPDEDIVLYAKWVPEPEVEIIINVETENTFDFDNENATNKDEISDILKDSITDEDKQAVRDGGRIEVIMTVKEIPKNVPNENRIANDGLLLAKHIELQLVKNTYDMDDKLINTENIDEVSRPIQFVIPVDQFAKEGREFFVYGEYGGRHEATRTPDGDGILIFQTVSFSTKDIAIFSIAYPPEDEPLPPEEHVVQTGDNAFIAMAATAGISALAFLATRRKKDDSDK